MEHIQEDYVSFETAKLLKEKGFIEKCNGSYYGSKYVITNNNVFCDEQILRPTQALVLKWLRIKHNISIEVGNSGYPWFNKWTYVIQRLEDKFKYNVIDNGVEFNFYEEAVGQAILYTLNNLI